MLSGQKAAVITVLEGSDKWWIPANRAVGSEETHLFLHNYKQHIVCFNLFLCSQPCLLEIMFTQTLNCLVQLCLCWQMWSLPHFCEWMKHVCTRDESLYVVKFRQPKHFGHFGLKWTNILCLWLLLTFTVLHQTTIFNPDLNQLSVSVQTWT